MAAAGAADRLPLPAAAGEDQGDPGTGAAVGSGAGAEVSGGLAVPAGVTAEDGGAGDADGAQELAAGRGEDASGVAVPGNDGSGAAVRAGRVVTGAAGTAVTVAVCVVMTGGLIPCPRVPAGAGDVPVITAGCAGCVL